MERNSRLILLEKPEEKPGIREGSLCAAKRKGGWKTLPFITASTFALNLAINGVTYNLIVFLIQQFNIKRIDAAQTANIINGCMNLAPVLSAIIADSYLGCYLVIIISSVISFLGIIPLTFTVIVPELRPPPCSPSSISCVQPSSPQYGVLYISLALIIIGAGGMRFTISTFAGDQFEDSVDRETSFNWYAFALNLSFVFASTAVTYTEDGISWIWGYGISLASSAIGIAILLAGKRYYRQIHPTGSAFIDLARVVVAAVRKITLDPQVIGHGYYINKEKSSMTTTHEATPAVTSTLRFLNKAAMITQGDVDSSGSIAKRWRLCTVHQVEDLKTILRLVPLWSSNILISVLLGIASNLTVLQAFTMDRRLGPHFSVPAATYGVFIFLAIVIALPCLDRILYPLLQRIFQRSPSLLQRVGVGHMLNTAAMASAALIECKRLSTWSAHGHSDQPDVIVPMSALWLVIPLVLVGVGEAFHFSSNASFYYQEFPASLKNTATSVLAMIIAIGFYVSAAVLGLIRSTSTWLPDNINKGRVDYVYWTLAVIGACNYLYFLLCAFVYQRTK